MSNLNPDQFRWVTTKDRDGHRAYASPGGSIVSKDGTGSTPVSVYYPGHTWKHPDYGMTDTVGEGKTWAELEEKHSR